MKEKISIEEFDNKKFKIRFVEEDDNRKAILTHYLHNYRNGVKKHYEKDAIEYLNQIVEYKNHEEKLNLVSDVALQQLLLKLKMYLFQLLKITLLNLLIYLQELVVLDLHCKI
ncbi:hypothetical protein H9X57_11095 [Flavobacterium piscinae]|uniref:hypothetical protein n=1 Tax=Flavobacterium piscinae TaxID=2506424 RepID=UPI0019B54713|nr:hypothetical protein [Flavobacterium piscinae]MBC8883711.1 hypothetical protein [Flavobacterium piscinae]